jgi:uncharacterized protein (DUF1800 family)
MKTRNLETWTLAEAAHLLNRAGFGGPPGEIRRVHALGPAAAVDWLLDGPAGDAPDPLPPPAWANEAAYREEAGRFLAARREMFAEARGAGEEEARRNAEARMKLNRMLREASRRQGVELTTWWFRRMVRGAHPLQEKMVLFWHGHFATSMEKVRAAYLMAKQNDLFRSHGLGPFAGLLKGVTRDPAMMNYLDLQLNRREKPNENFAREVMELFTLGEGNYSEDDIRAAARAFTGLRFDRATGRSSFVAFQHDGGDKTLFGETGRFGPDEVVGLLLEQPACATFLARKLWRYFVGDAPGDAQVAALAGVLRDNQFHIGRSLRALFLSEEFYAPGNIRAQIKAPVVFLAMLARQLELDDLPLAVLAAAMRDMGQVLFLPPNVAGWPGGAAWITTNTLFARYNVAGSVCRAGDPEFTLPGGNERRGAMNERLARRAGERLRRDWPKPDYAALAPPSLRGAPERLVDELVFRLFQHPLRPADRLAFLDYARNQAGGGIDDREVGRLVHLMMSTPHYQLA